MPHTIPDEIYVLSTRAYGASECIIKKYKPLGVFAAGSGMGPEYFDWGGFCLTEEEALSAQKELIQKKIDLLEKQLKKL